MTLNSEATILLACARLTLDARWRERLDSACKGSAVDWNLVHRAATAHKIAPLVFQNLQACGLTGPIPPSLVAAFRRGQRQSIARSAAVAEAIPRIAAFFAARAHEILLPKHAALAADWGRLHRLTTSEDLDIVVRPAGEAQSDSLGCYLGSASIGPDPTWAVIDEFNTSERRKFAGINPELDNRIHHDVTWNRLIPIDFRQVWRDATARLDGCAAVRIPDENDLVVMSAVNVFRKPRPRLRNLVEIRELISGGRHFDWDALARKAEAYRCSILVDAAIDAARSCLGDFPDGNPRRTLRPPSWRSRSIMALNRRLAAAALGAASDDDAARAIGARGMDDLVRRFVVLGGRRGVRFLWSRAAPRRFGGIERP